jgi:hypothetical protein
VGPRARKFAFTQHIVFSVGWLGSVAVFIALAVTGIATSNIQSARAAYLAMEISSRYVIVPFCLAALTTGIVQSLGTKWGLFKYYWIAVKLILTVIATILLLLHLQPIGEMSRMAEEITFSDKTMSGSRIRLLADAIAGFLLISVILILSVYKPWGRIQNEAEKRETPWRRYLLTALGIFLLFVIILHLFGGRMHGH